ncbi:MAG: hypothetical protein ABJA98_24005 [Acidobacteriota bacterium]
MQPIVIEALLVRGENDRVRVILGPYCLDFEADDLLNLEEIPLPCGLTEGHAIAARVTLKPGARLMGIGSADVYRDVLWRREVPFSLATRPTAVFKADAAMKKREDAFFAARGFKERLS